MDKNTIHSVHNARGKSTVLQKLKDFRGRKKDILPPHSNLTYFALTFREPRTIQIMHPSQDCQTSVVAIIKSVWKPGIAEVTKRSSQDVCNIKLNGSPFWYSFSHEFALQVHELVLKLISQLDKRGYRLMLASDIARYFELSTLFFTIKSADQRSITQSRSQFMSVTISHNNQLQLASCSLSNKLAITQLINNTWHYGINKEISLPSGYIIILNGAPWTNKKLAVSARSLLHQLVLLLSNRGWRLVTSARIKNHRDTLIFHYDESSNQDWYAVNEVFLSLSLSEKDKLRVIHSSNSNIIKELREIITVIWRPGLKADHCKYGGHEFVLEEKPWWCESTEAIRTRYFICDLLEQLYSKGFKIHASIECHPDLTEKTTLTFKKGPARKSKVVCISFDEDDKLRIINGSEIFVSAVRNVLLNRVGKDGIRKEREFLKSVEFTLDLNSWDGRDRHGSQIGKSICCHLLQKISEIGWCVVLSADTTSAVKGNNNRRDIPVDVHSWYLIQSHVTGSAVSRFKTIKSKKQGFSTGEVRKSDGRLQEGNDTQQGISSNNAVEIYRTNKTSLINNLRETNV